jgi:uncharacterized protein (TIGR02996 family)
MLTKEEQDRQRNFLELLKNDPCNLVTHLVYADWLEERGLDDYALLQKNWTQAAYEEAQDYLLEYAGDCNITVETLLAGARNYLEHDRSLIIGTQTPDIAYEDQEEFWRHFMTITGIPVPETKRQDNFIGCAC